MSLTSTPTSLALRLDALSRDELLELAAGALDELPKGHHLRNQADALVAKRKPLPAWCVDGVLLSPDLLPHLFESISLRDCAAAAACSAWSGAWVALLRLRRYVHPVPRRIDLTETTDQMPVAVAAMPDGAICVTGRSHLHFLTAQGEPIPGGGAWAALAQVEFDDTFGVLRHGDSLLVVDMGAHHVRRLRLSDGVELARSPVLRNPFEIAIAGDRLFVPTDSTVSVLDVATLELRYTFGDIFDHALDCAIHDDKVYVADQAPHGELHVYDLDGTPSHAICGQFGAPSCISIKDGRIYLLECMPDRYDDHHDERQERGEGLRLLVLELDGTTRQEIRFCNMTFMQGLCFLGDELWIPELHDCDEPAITVLRFFGGLASSIA